ncbi:hypothetical protein Tco_1434980, partial [Tanacetum coccineum]
ISMMDMLLKSEDENKYYPMELHGDNQKIPSDGAAGEVTTNAHELILGL